MIFQKKSLFKNSHFLTPWPQFTWKGLNQKIQKWSQIIPYITPVNMHCTSFLGEKINPNMFSRQQWDWFRKSEISFAKFDNDEVIAFCFVYSGRLLNWLISCACLPWKFFGKRQLQVYFELSEILGLDSSGAIDTLELFI